MSYLLSFHKLMSFHINLWKSCHGVHSRNTMARCQQATTLQLPHYTLTSCNSPVFAKFSTTHGTQLHNCLMHKSLCAATPSHILLMSFLCCYCLIPTLFFVLFDLLIIVFVCCLQLLNQGQSAINETELQIKLPNYDKEGNPLLVMVSEPQLEGNGKCKIIIIMANNSLVSVMFLYF